MTVNKRRVLMGLSDLEIEKKKKEKEKQSHVSVAGKKYAGGQHWKEEEFRPLWDFFFFGNKSSF